jgi:hypothetical protein
MMQIVDNFGLIQNLRAGRFILKLRATEKIVLPEYKGSTFRGVLGWRLKQVICVNRDVADCKDCLLAQKCLYNYLFSPQLPPETQFLKHTSRIPSPIIIEPPLTDQRIFQADDTMEVGLVLIGKGVEYLPYLIYVFTEIGKSGIGAGVHERAGKKRGGRFELVEAYDDIGGKLIYSSQENILRDGYRIFDWDAALAEQVNNSQKLTLEFLTPIRFREMRGDNFKLAKLENFTQLITHLYWRLLMLAYFHCNPCSLDDKRFHNLAEQASHMRKELSKVDDVQLEENHTYWQEYERWSNRQETKMTLGGFMGRTVLSGKLTPYLPLLHLGQYTHLGKQTMFGFGKYRLGE